MLYTLHNVAEGIKSFTTSASTQDAQAIHAVNALLHTVAATAMDFHNRLSTSSLHCGGAAVLAVVTESLCHYLGGVTFLLAGAGTNAQTDEVFFASCRFCLVQALSPSLSPSGKERDRDRDGESLGTGGVPVAAAKSCHKLLVHRCKDRDRGKQQSLSLFLSQCLDFFSRELSPSASLSLLAQAGQSGATGHRSTDENGLRH